LLVGAAAWLWHENAPASSQAPRGVMVSLDAVNTGFPTAAANLPKAVAPTPAQSAQPTPAPMANRAPSVQPAPVNSVNPTRAAPETAKEVTPSAADDAPRTSSTAEVKIPVAQAVTIDAANAESSIRPTEPV